MTTLHEAAKALVQRIDRGRKEYQEAWPDDDRELDALRAALASPSPPDARAEAPRTGSRPVVPDAIGLAITWLLDSAHDDDGAERWSADTMAARERLEWEIEQAITDAEDDAAIESQWCNDAGPMDAVCDRDRGHGGAHRGWSTEGRTDWLPAPPARDERAEAPRWMPGGAFCDCGAVEFMVPGTACIRVEERGTQPTQHTPTECRTATWDELENLTAPESVEAPPAPLHNDAAKETK